MLQAMNQKGQKGFTLVELMIVVAIIGILAAIAIPQFAQYRIRGFNASAMSDLRNLNTTQAAFFTDWNRYGYTVETEASATVGGGNSVVALTEGINVAGVLRGGEMAGYFIGALVSDVRRVTPIVVGSNVEITAHSSDGTVAGMGTTFVAAAKHFQGNTIYAVDADASPIYRNPDLRDAGEHLLATDIPQAATLTTDDDLDLFVVETTGYVAS